MRNLAWRVCNAKKVLVGESYTLDEIILSNSLLIDVELEADEFHPGALLAFSFAGCKHTNADPLLVAGRSSRRKGKCCLGLAFKFIHIFDAGMESGWAVFRCVVVKACGPINAEQDTFLYIELYTIPIL